MALLPDWRDCKDCGVYWAVRAHHPLSPLVWIKDLIAKAASGSAYYMSLPGEAIPDSDEQLRIRIGTGQVQA